MRIVVARSAAETPVVTPTFASIVTVNCVPKRDEFVATWSGRWSASAFSFVIVRQTIPLPCRIMKFIASVVVFSAASTRSPSFSRSGSSTRITMRPARNSSNTSGRGENGIP